MSSGPSRLAAVEAFKHLTPEELAGLEQASQQIAVARGQVLMRQGEEADALYIVVSGRFRVTRDGAPAMLAEIGAGSPIGEIAFFAGGTRTATVTAERDSLVLALRKADFERLAERLPRIWSTITVQLARRLGETATGAARKSRAIPHTITVCRAGGAETPPDFVDEFAARLAGAFKPGVAVMVLTSATAAKALPQGVPLESSEATQWFNALEGRCELVVYVADGELTEWTKKALRQADFVLCVGRHAPGVSRAPGLVEHYAEALHAPAMLRLVLVHDRPPPFSGSREWLDPRPWIAMHHHVLADAGAAGQASFERLARFMRGRAVGLVACGGGAYSSAHIGLFEALAGAGIEFDVLGGTSGGGAMTAALALGLGPDDIERRTHEIFVARKAMRRWTWPRYSLLDHTEFDRALAEHFTALDIEDLPVPFFAVSTNLSRNAAQCLRSGPLWQAVRASSAIPALLPPVFTADGEMLVDGCLVENVPLKTMLAFKTGPNVVIDFCTPTVDRFTIDSGMLPARGELILRMLSSLAGRRAGSLPEAPGPQSVLLRSLMLNRPDYAADLGPEDIVLAPAIPSHIGHLDWHRHAELRCLAREYAARELDRLRAEAHPLLLR